MRLLSLLMLVLSLGCGLVAQDAPLIELRSKGDQSQIDVLVDGQLFTSYRYAANLKKPVLWPVVTAAGNEVTRSYPLKDKPGERVDHPHHVGVWLNYGDVNGLDFWNNSTAIKVDRAAHYGNIQHQKVTKIKGGKGEANLVTTASWHTHTGETLLREKSQFHFTVQDQVRIIDRTTSLMAVVDTVRFTDNKEGMFAIRVCRELELPSTKKQKLSGPNESVIEVETPDNAKVTGNYLSSEGIAGGDVWGTRAKWMQLSGTIEDEQVSIIIFDHPENVGYPTYWHARGYGLFSANTLGQAVFSKGENRLNFHLPIGESVTFKYRMAIISGTLTSEEIEAMAQAFSQKR